MLPSYLEELSFIELKERAEELKALMLECRLCPNSCGANRLEDETGLCSSSDAVKISSFGPHFGEESPLVGINGSGTIFFTNCNLSCVFCQNYDISQLGVGREISIEDLARLMLRLQNQGCHNINFVTPTHFTPQIVESLALAVDKGLEIPLVYNCGGYESTETLRLLDNIFDIYMPDIKYSEELAAESYSGVKDYWAVVKKALKEMYMQVGDLKTSRSGIAQRGLLIRHLVLPHSIAGSKKVIDFIAEEISENAYLNIMDQYHPAFKASEYKELNRYTSEEEYLAVVAYAKSKGLSRGFYA
jgi:putative pyruvate formate lyase activating enzyme